MKITLLSDDAIRLEPDEGPMTIEAVEAEQQYSPFHMLASSLAYCTFSVLYSWATHTRQSADDLAIDVRWKFSDDEPHRVSELDVTYTWPSLPAKKREAAKRVAHMCTVHETLLTPPRITVEANGE
ncbi:MAG TPA: OsmC family protein [Gemmatimonadaceae bacterium]|nr:OsmC family protein [Gemmatimonadaceae bacterium]